MQIEKTLTSLEVAEMVGKDHNKLLRDIRGYIEQLGESKIGHTNFFEATTYITEQNKTMPCYKVTKKGCEFIANKLTGTKGTAFTAKYINRFHEMETALRVPSTALGQIQLIAQGCIELEQKIDNVERDLQTFKQEMPLLGVDMDVLKKAVNVKVVDALGGIHSNAYNNKSVRGKVYSDCWNELKRQFGFVKSYKEMKRNQIEAALQIIETYNAPMVLQDLINSENSQLRLENC